MFYDETYCTYVEKKYYQVLRYIKWGQNQFGINKLSPQIAYLSALAVGHTITLNPFESALQRITTDFPNDNLVVPLVKKHLIFIDKHRAAFARRPIVLVDNESAGLSFIEEPQMEIVQTPSPTQVETAAVSASITPTQEPKPAPIALVSPPALGINNSSASATFTQPTALPNVPAAPNVVESVNDAFFSTAESGSYYFIVYVSQSVTNLSSSRFGIGQFNRSNFSDSDIKHQLKLLNDQNQLIFVGEFSSQAAAAAYYQKISPLISTIMKVPADTYKVFYISKPNFDKLKDQQTTDWYLHFFKNKLIQPPTKHE